MKNLITPLRIALVLALIGAAVVGFVLVPAGTMLPVHWNAAGTADGFASRESALLWPLGVTAIAWAAVALLTILARPADVKGGMHSSGVVLTALTALFLVIEVATVLIGTGVAVNMMQTIGFAMAVLLIVLGNSLPKSQPNSIAGIRIPTTLQDPANWQATHRFTGWLCVAGGVVLAVAAALAPTILLIWFLVACIAGPMIAGTLYSRAYARRRGI